MGAGRGGLLLVEGCCPVRNRFMDCAQTVCVELQAMHKMIELPVLPGDQDRVRYVQSQGEVFDGGQLQAEPDIRGRR